MARSRRRNRRSTSQNAASLLALALPSPLQRLANSQLGPLLMFFGLPAMLVFGLLQIEWQNGTPQLKVNTQKASELREAVKDQWGNLESQPMIQQWQQATRDAWNAQQPNVNQPYTQQPYSQRPNADTAVVRNSQAPFLSTNPPTYVSTSNTQTPAADQYNLQTRQQQSIQQQQQYSQPQYPQQQYAQQQYAQQQYAQQQYAQQQYAQQQYPQQQYAQPQYSQQQFDQIQLDQQRLYQHQLYQQQAAQQQATPPAQSWPAQSSWQTR